jgi:hypothetical protein
LDDEEEEDGSGGVCVWLAPGGSRRRRVTEQAKLVIRIERHASRGSIKRAAAALGADPLADASHPVVIAKLRAFHPGADPPTALAIDTPAIPIFMETLEPVERRLNAHNRGTAGGPKRVNLRAGA